MVALWLLLLSLPAFYVATFTHELGHFVAARLSGLRIEAFGVGFRPLVSFRIGSTILFFSAPWQLSGLTLSLYDGLRRESGWRSIVFLSGGMVFNLLFAVVALLAFPMAPSLPGKMFVGLFGAMSVMEFLFSAIPFRIRSGKTPVIANDARLILDQILKRPADVDRLGLYLGTLASLREFCRRIGARNGERLAEISTAMMRAALHDLEGAKAILAGLTEDGPRGPVDNGDLRAYAEAVVAVASNEEDGLAKIEEATQRALDQPRLVRALEVLEAEWRERRGEETTDLLREIATSEEPADRLVRLSAEAAVFRRAQPEDYQERAEDWLRRSAGSGTLDQDRLRVLMYCAEREASARGTPSEAMTFTNRLLDEYRLQVGSIADVTVRAAFSQYWRPQIARALGAEGLVDAVAHGGGGPEAVVQRGTKEARARTATRTISFLCLCGAVCIAAGGMVAIDSVEFPSRLTSTLLAAGMALGWWAFLVSLLEMFLVRPYSRRLVGSSVMSAAVGCMGVSALLLAFHDSGKEPAIGAECSHARIADERDENYRRIVESCWQQACASQGEERRTLFRDALGANQKIVSPTEADMDERAFVAMALANELATDAPGEAHLLARQGMDACGSIGPEARLEYLPRLLAVFRRTARHEEERLNAELEIQMWIDWAAESNEVALHRELEALRDGEPEAGD